MRPARRVIDRWAFDHNGSDGGRAAKEGSRASTNARWRHGRDGLLRDPLRQMSRAADCFGGPRVLSTHTRSKMRSAQAAAMGRGRGLRSQAWLRHRYTAPHSIRSPSERTRWVPAVHHLCDAHFFCAMLPADAPPDHHFPWKTPAGSLRARTKRNAGTRDNRS